MVRKFREDGLIKLELNVDELRDKFSIIKDQINKFTLKDYSLDGNRIQDAWKFSKEVKGLAQLEIIMEWLGLYTNENQFHFRL